MKSLGFFLEMIANDFHAILAPIEFPWMIDLSIHKGGVSTESGGNVAVDFPSAGSFRIEFSLTLRNLETHFEVGIDDEGNLELVLPIIDLMKEFGLGMSTLNASWSLQYI